MPQGWDAAEAKLNDSPNADIRAQAQALSLTFGSSSALASLRKTLMDETADAGGAAHGDGIVIGGPGQRTCAHVAKAGR